MFKPRNELTRALMPVITLAVLATPSPAAARSERFPAEVSVGAELGAGQLDEDLFAHAALATTVRLRVPAILCSGDSSPPCKTNARLALRAPVRLRVVDRAPEQDGVLRAQDWDEPSDAARILRQVSYGEPGEPFFFRVGTLAGYSLGSGTLVDRYANVINPDRYSLGAALDVRASSFEAQAVVDDLSSATLIGAALALRPSRWFTRRRTILDRFSLTGQVAADLRAPVELERDADALVVVDDTSAPVVARDEVMALFGAGVRWGIYSSSSVALSASAEANFASGMTGYGQHLTVAATWIASDSIALHASGEVAVASGGYVPRYFGPLYNIERFLAPGLGQVLPSPKKLAASTLSGDAAIYSTGELGAEVDRWGAAANVMYTRASRRPEADALTISLRAAPTELFELRAFYHQNLFDSSEQLFSLKQSVLISELKVPFARYFYAVGRYNRRWRLRDDGVASSIDDWNVGVGAAFAVGLDRAAQ